MCWNAEVSLNTFLFSSFVMLLVIYNNNYTQYKINFVDSSSNLWAYMFMFSFIFIQLIEFFIWKNVHNPVLNSFFTLLATILLLIQPIASMMLLSGQMRTYLIVPYLLLVIPFFLYRYNTKKIISSITPLNHLHWNSLLYSDENMFFIVWLFFFLFPLFYQGYIFGFLFGFVTLLVMAYNYNKDRSFGSMWCWVVNTVVIYYAVYLLFYLPFFEGRGRGRL